MTETTDLFLAVGRLEGKVDALLSNQARVEKRMDDNESRLSALEAKDENRSGIFRGVNWIVMAASGLIAFFVPYLPKVF